MNSDTKIYRLSMEILGTSEGALFKRILNLFLIFLFFSVMQVAVKKNARKFREYIYSVY